MTESSSNPAEATPTEPPTRSRAASLFDLRWILTLLFGIYGIVVTLMGLFSHASTVAASGQQVGVNVNLWTGIPMLVLAIAFGLWAQLRPVRIEASADGTAEQG
jgi:hypothetical protein